MMKMERNRGDGDENQSRDEERIGRKGDRKRVMEKIGSREKIVGEQSEL